MTDICLPIDASGGAPSFPAAQHRVALAALMQGRTDRPLGARSGVRPGSDPTISATSTTWTVTPFAAIVDPLTALTVGPYLVAFTANKTGAINAANASNPRIDRLDLQVPDDPSGGTTVPVIVYTAGVAASSPVAPAAPARSTPLATILVPKVGGGSPAVTNTFLHAPAAGGIIPTRSSSEYPPNPFVGEYVDDASLGITFRWNGTAWVPLTRPLAKVVYDAGTLSPATGTTLMASWATTGLAIAKGLTTSAAGITGPAYPCVARVSANARFAANSSGRRGIFFTINGAQPSHQEQDITPAAAGGPTAVVIATLLSLAAGDVVSVDLFQDSGAGLTLQSATLDLEVVG